MAISFNEIPANYRAPSQFVEFDNSNAMQGATSIEYKALLIGGKLDSGSSNPLEAEIITTYEQAQEKYGKGSQLALMVNGFRKVDEVTKLYCIALDDDESAVAATASIEIVGTVTVAAPINLYIGGQGVRVSAPIGADAATLVQNMVAAVNMDMDLPVTASLVDGKVTLTAKNKGETGNEIDVRFSYYQEAMPQGVAFTITPFSGGAGNAFIEEVMAVIGDDWYHILSMAYTDRANLRVLEDELLDRWGPLRHIDGAAVVAKSGTFSELVSFGTDREQGNYQNVSIVESVKTPDLPFVRAATVAGTLAFYGAIDPARPFQTLILTGLMAPAYEDRLTKMEQNQLLFSGIATTMIDAGGNVQVQRAITNYQYSASGAVDTSYLDINTRLTLSYLRYDFRNRLLRKYPRHKLATDSSEVSPGQAIMTPALGKAEAVAAYEDWIELGLCENMNVFKKGLICERNATDPNRLDWLMTPDLVNQFRIGATKIQFLL